MTVAEAMTDSAGPVDLRPARAEDADAITR